MCQVAITGKVRETGEGVLKGLIWRADIARSQHSQLYRLSRVWDIIFRTTVYYFDHSSVLRRTKEPTSGGGQRCIASTVERIILLLPCSVSAVASRFPPLTKMSLPCFLCRLFLHHLEVSRTAGLLRAQQSRLPLRLLRPAHPLVREQASLGRNLPFSLHGQRSVEPTLSPWLSLFLLFSPPWVRLCT